MSILIALAALAAEPPRAPAITPMCQNTQSRMVTVRKGRGPHKLGEEPRAEAYRAVLRTVDGCTRPVKVREDVGAR